MSGRIFSHSAAQSAVAPLHKLEIRCLARAWPLKSACVTLIETSNRVSQPAFRRREKREALRR